MNKVFVALVTGIVTGILIAPRKGSHTRSKLVEGFNDVAEKLLTKKEDNMYQRALDTIGEHIGASDKV